MTAQELISKGSRGLILMKKNVRKHRSLTLAEKQKNKNFEPQFVTKVNILLKSKIGGRGNIRDPNSPSREKGQKVPLRLPKVKNSAGRIKVTPVCTKVTKKRR